MAIQQVSVFVQNKPGALSAICKLLAESGVDMRAMFISDTKEFSIPVSYTHLTLPTNSRV